MKELMTLLAEVRATGDYDRLVKLVPYAEFLGMDIAAEEQGSLLFRLAYRPENIGNALLPALHGGVLAAFMEHSAMLQILWSLDSPRLPKAVDFSIDYLRTGRPEPTYARCSIIRQGRRVANVAVTAWQSDSERAIATARTHFLLALLE